MLLSFQCYKPKKPEKPAQVMLLYLHLWCLFIIMGISQTSKVTTGNKSLIGPPRQLSLTIACDPKRPCIKANWLPPRIISTLGSENESFSKNTPTNSDLIAYRIRYTVVEPLDKANAQAPHSSDGNNYFRMVEKNVTRLYFQTTAGEHLFGVQYEVRVAAVSNKGIGPEISDRIALPEAAPSDAPDNFRIIRGDETSIHLVWGPPSFQYRNGHITHYQIRCYILGSEESTETLHNVQSNEIVLTDLPAATQACFVRAWTKAGSGPWSNRVLFRTHAKAVGPPSPKDVQGFRLSPTTILVRWRHPSAASTISHYVVYYKIGQEEGGREFGWTSHVTRPQATSVKLENLRTDSTYVLRISSVDSRGSEGPPSETVLVKPVEVTPTSNRTAGRQPDIGQQTEAKSGRSFRVPDYYAVRNLKCSKEEAHTIGLEWLPPVEVNHLVEYQVHYTGRKEYFTNLGILKSVHLSKGNHRQSHRKAESFKQSNWPLDGSIPVDNKLELQYFRLERLESNSQYEFVVRPMYALDRSIDDLEQQEGISVTVICQTGWKKPRFVPAPKLEVIHLAPVTSPSSVTLIELRIFRVSEENSPIHDYYIIAAQERCTSFEGIDKLKDPDQYSLLDLSNAARQASSREPYLTIASTTSKLFPPNQEAAIALIGAEQLSRRHRKAELQWNNSNIRDIRSAERNEVHSDEIRAVNKPIDVHCTYRVACRTCSRYPDGQKLCATSNWSEPIYPMGSNSPHGAIMETDTPSSSSMIASLWSGKNPSKITVAIISLTCGLIFFAILSGVLGCLLKYRKRHMTERHVLGSATQWDAKICEDISKSMIADERLQPFIPMLSDKHQGCAPFNEQSGRYMIARSSSGLHSPSESSLGFSGLKVLYPSHGGLATGMVVSTSLNAPSLRSTDIECNSTGNPTPEATRVPLPVSSPNSTNQSVNSTAINLNICDRFDVHDQMRNGVGINSFIKNSPSFTNQLPIPITQFVEFVCRARHEHSSIFAQEFQMIERNATATCYPTLHGLLERNKDKNRCTKILPFDHNRVILQTPTSDCYSDYINANFVDGHQKLKAYIATQAPLPGTMESFWWMVWHQNSFVIVALTDLVEQGERRCDKYWPSTGSFMYGEIVVTHLETTELAYYVMRTFMIQKSGCTEQRKIWQLQYTNWPINPVPTQSVTFMMFLRRVGTITLPEHGPTIVHCSLGTGRTGLFIALDILLEQIKLEQSVDVFGLVSRLRAQRMRLVETMEQYQLIYHTLMDAISDGNTEVFARNLGSHVEHLNSIQTSNPMIPKSSATMQQEVGYTGFQIEFRKLNSTAPSASTTTPASSPISFASGSPIRYTTWYKSTISCEVANLSINQCKNRLLSIVPFDWNRVPLCPIRGVDSSNYINASFVDGYRTKNAYIACQAPTASTVEDFWRMVWEHKSECIVMICNVKEGGSEKCFKYWPSEKASRYQFFVVDPTGEYNVSGHIVREFKVTDARDGESRTLRQMQFTRWPEHGVPTSGDSLISLIGQVQKIKTQSGNDGPVTVHCSSGAGRTGVFITLCNVLERLRQESVVDMYQTVKLLRQQRVGMVQTEEQYRFCYLVALEYLSSFDLCTQPKSSTTISAIGSPSIPHKMRFNAREALTVAASQHHTSSNYFGLKLLTDPCLDGDLTTYQV